jgi:putative ABC transport system permease protein
MGASIRQVAYKLSIDFLKLVAIAVVVGLPLSWFVMNRWLETFSYRVDIGIWTLVIAASIAALISLLTVSYQSIKAALANPVNSLRSE